MNVAYKRFKVILPVCAVLGWTTVCWLLCVMLLESCGLTREKVESSKSDLSHDLGEKAVRTGFGRE